MDLKELKKSLENQIESLDYYSKELKDFLEENEVFPRIKGNYEGQILSMSFQKGYLQELLRKINRSISE